MDQSSTIREAIPPGKRWARVVSDVLSPPVIWAVLAVPIAIQDAAALDTQLGRSQRVVMWILIYDLLVCVLPVAYIAFEVWRGKITDIHIKVRKQRIRPFLVTLLCGSLALCLLVYVGAPRLMPLFALFSLIQLALMLIITFFWQISMHAMGITGAVVATGALFGPVPGLLIAPLIPLVGAARVTLRRHTVKQVIAGGLLGGTLTAICFALV